MRKVSACEYDEAALAESPHPRELCLLATRGALLHPELEPEPGPLTPSLTLTTNPDPDH